MSFPLKQPTKVAGKGSKCSATVAIIASSSTCGVVEDDSVKDGRSHSRCSVYRYLGQQKRIKDKPDLQRRAREPHRSRLESSFEFSTLLWGFTVHSCRLLCILKVKLLLIFPKHKYKKQLSSRFLRSRFPAHCC